MRPSDGKPIFYFQADASGLGGALQTPEMLSIPPQAGISLPSVGGRANAQVRGFRLGTTVSVESAQTTVTGEQRPDGSASIHVTSEIQGLDILGVIKADRIVAELAIECPVYERRRISLAESVFEGLRVENESVLPTINSVLRPSEGAPESDWEERSWRLFQRVGREQAERLQAAFENGRHRDMCKWVRDRYRWMTMNTPEDELALCSLVDSLGGDVRGGDSVGHIIEIPEYGRFFFGELLVSPVSVRLTMIRAELGCKTSGGISVGSASANGTTVPPGKPH